MSSIIKTNCGNCERVKDSVCSKGHWKSATDEQLEESINCNDFYSKNKLKVIIAGGRKFKNKAVFNAVIDKILPDHKSIEIVTGMADGADMLGYYFALNNYIKVHEYPAKWDDIETEEPCVVKYNSFGKPYNSLAGYNRNEKMAEVGDILVAFWDMKSTGTKDMIDRARRHQLIVQVINLTK